MKYINGFKTIESTDEFYCNVQFKWLQVPSFWVGDGVGTHQHSIRSNEMIEETKDTSGKPRCVNCKIAQENLELISEIDSKLQTK